jgi:hypothetical protein
MTGALAILSTVSVALASLMVLSCLLLAGRADRKITEFCDYNFEPENPNVSG